MMTRHGKYGAESPETILLLRCPVHLTFDLLIPDLIKNIFVSRVIYMHDIMESHRGLGGPIWLSILYGVSTWKG